MASTKVKFHNKKNDELGKYLFKRSKKQSVGLLMKRILFVCASISVFIVFLQIIFLFNEASDLLEYASFKEFLFGKHWRPSDDVDRAVFGAAPLIVGSLAATIGALIIAVPIGIGVAVYISEMAPSKLKNIAKSIIEILAGIPSVIFGFFGLTVLNGWIKDGFNQPVGASWFGASLILGVMILPTIISVSEDALRSVPNEFREASLGMGANKWQTITRVVLPSASSGITTSIILGMGRAIGETMAVVLAAGNTALIPEPITNMFVPIRTLTASVAFELKESDIGGPHYTMLFGLIILLFMIIIILNSVAQTILGKMQRKFNPKPQNGSKSKTKETRFKWIIKAVQDKLNEFKGWYKNHSGLLNRLIFYPFIVWVLFSWLIYEQAISFLTVIIIPLIIMGVDLIYQKGDTKKKQKIGFYMIYASLGFVIISLGIILGFVFVRGAMVVDWEFITGRPIELFGDWEEGGISPAIIGSLQIMGGAIGIAIPLGVGAGIYLAEYAKETKAIKIIRMGIDNLNGTPSIVFGVFGYVVFSNFFNWGFSLLAGQFTVALMVLPTIIRTTEQSIKQVSDSLREGSLGLGATKWETIKKVVIPASGAGIITGVILAMGRAIGETAPIMFTAATTSRKSATMDPMKPVMALPYFIYIMASVGMNQAALDVAYGAAFILIVIVMFFYGTAMCLRKKINKKLLKSFTY